MTNEQRLVLGNTLLRHIHNARGGTPLAGVLADDESWSSIREQLIALGPPEPPTAAPFDILIDRLALSIATNDPAPMREFADQVVPVYRRRKVSMDDLIKIANALRAAAAPYVDGAAAAPMHAAIDAAIAVFKWNRRIAGDARKRNKLLQLLYKGA